MPSPRWGAEGNWFSGSSLEFQCRCGKKKSASVVSHTIIVTSSAGHPASSGAFSCDRNLAQSCLSLIYVPSCIAPLVASKNWSFDRDVLFREVQAECPTSAKLANGIAAEMQKQQAILVACLILTRNTVEDIMIVMKIWELDSSHTRRGVVLAPGCLNNLYVPNKTKLSGSFGAQLIHNRQRDANH